MLLFRFPVTIPRRKKQSLNSLIGSASILLMPEQSLNRGGNNLDLLFTASIRRKEELQQGLKNVDRSSLITNKERETKVYRAVENADYQTQVNAFAGCLMKPNETVRKKYGNIQWQRLSDFMNSVVQKYFASKRLHSRIPHLASCV